MFQLKTKVWLTVVIGVVLLGGIAAIDFFVLGGDVRTLFLRQYRQAALRPFEQGQQSHTAAPTEKENAAETKPAIKTVRPTLRFFPTDESKTFVSGKPIEVFCSLPKGRAPRFSVEQKETTLKWNALKVETAQSDEKVGAHVTFVPERTGIHTLRCKTSYDDASLLPATAVGSFYVAQ